MGNVVSISDTELPFVTRLNSLARLTPAETDALVVAGRHSSTFPARRDIARAGAALAGPRILVEGWAAHVRDFRDGRRQILSLVLPGDLILPVQPGERAATTTIALTATSIARAPLAESSESGLGLAYALSADVERICLLRQIARIGRLDACQRLADLFLELADRLDLAGLSASQSFALPLTQEMLADCLGLTSVHVNRMLQQMRRDGMIEDRGRTITLLDPDRLRAFVDYQPLTMAGRVADR